MLEVVDEARHLDLVLVDPEDRGDRVVRPARRRVGVPLRGRLARVRDRVDALECRRHLQRAAGVLERRPQPGGIGRPAVAAEHAERGRDDDEAEHDARDPRDDRHGPTATSALVGGNGALFRRLHAGFVGHAPREGTSGLGSARVVQSAVRRPDYRASAQWSSLPCSSVSCSARSPSSSRSGRRSSSAGGASQEVIELERALAGAEAELAVERGSSDERLEAAIKALSTEALDANSARFLELAETHLSGHVRPLKDSLARMDHQLQSVERVRQEAYGELKTQVATLSERAGSLTNALRTPHVRGRWGESSSGTSSSSPGWSSTATTSRRRRRRPTTAPCGPTWSSASRAASTSWSTRRRRSTAYLDAFETSDEVERERRFADHARQVREHVTKLSAKAYWRQFEPSPDFVVMFLPDESYLRAAHEHDPSLQEYAWSSNVILASPSTLMVLLRTVSMTWQQETIAESAREVSDLGRELYKRLATMGAHFAKLGRTLDGAVNAYNETVGSLERQVLVQARRFEQHGITGIEPPELQPIERQTRTLAAAELVEPVRTDRSRRSRPGADAA